jgi:hypothetical protein
MSVLSVERSLWTAAGTEIKRIGSAVRSARKGTGDVRAEGQYIVQEMKEKLLCPRVKNSKEMNLFHTANVRRARTG